MLEVHTSHFSNVPSGKTGDIKQLQDTVKTHFFMEWGFENSNFPVIKIMHYFWTTLGMGERADVFRVVGKESSQVHLTSL